MCIKPLDFFVLILLGTGLSAQDVEVGFAARGQDPSAEALVLKVINSAQFEIRMEAYNFTDPEITQALVTAAKRGVNVKIVHDYTASKEKGDRTKALTDGGCQVRLDRKYKIMHDKVVIVDRMALELGSFNYTVSAQKENAENVLVLWKAPQEVTAKYLEEWKRLWDESE